MIWLMPRYPTVPCAGCSKLLWPGKGCLPPGQQTCRDCRARAGGFVRGSRAPGLPGVCADCGGPTSGQVVQRCRPCWLAYHAVDCSEGCDHSETAHRRLRRSAWNLDIDRLRASRRKTNHRRRSRIWQTDITPAWELALRNSVTECPLCGVTLLPKPLQPTSKELDHIVPLHRGGLHMMTNVRIICRHCNVTRDYRDVQAIQSEPAVVVEPIVAAEPEPVWKPDWPQPSRPVIAVKMNGKISLRWATKLGGPA